MRYIRIILFICIITNSIKAQELKYNFELNGNVANGSYTPFWHVSNRQGLGTVDTNSGYLRTSLFGKHAFKNKNIIINWGADFVLANNHTSTLFIQQAYGEIDYKKLRLTIGQKERWNHIKNHRLTTGGLTESGNARPIPQIRIEIPEYWDIFKTSGWFSLRGHIAYGWFSDGEWQKDFVEKGKKHTVGVRYHSKAGYIKLGNEEKFPLTFEGGLEMVAQFGGTVYNAGNKEGYNLYNPTGLKDYWKSFIPSSGDNSYHKMDQGNIAGNHLGSWHAALTWHDKNWNLKTYYEHTFEDHSQMFMEYGIWTEQLVGIELQLNKFNWIKSLVLEYFNLKKHAGPIYHDSTEKIPDQISCEDDNYNHEWYTGWFNYGMVIGTPLVTSPIYNKNNNLECYNNRVEAYHFGIEGEPLKNLLYRIMLTSSNNWGTYRVPFTDIKENISGLFEITYSHEKLKDWSITASFAFDKGELYGNNRGGMISIRKNGVLNLKNDKK